MYKITYHASMVTSMVSVCIFQKNEKLVLNVLLYFEQSAFLSSSNTCL